MRRQEGTARAKWPIVDISRFSAVRAGVDAVALGTWQNDMAGIDASQIALAGLVSATYLSVRLYPGWGNRAVRGRLCRIAGTQWTAVAVRHAIAAASAA